MEQYWVALFYFGFILKIATFLKGHCHDDFSAIFNKAGRDQGHG